MGDWLKQSTAVIIKFGPFLDKIDGVSEEIGLTIAQANIRLTKNGGNIAQSNNAAGATHDELGYYGVPLNTTDTNTLGTLRVVVHDKTLHLPVWQDFMVVPANVWDSMFGADKLQVDVNQWNNSNIAAPDTVGYPKVTVKDGAGAGEINTDAGKIVEVEILSGHTAQTGDGYVIVNHASHGNAKLVRSTTPANTLDINSDGNVTASNIASGGGNLNSSAESFTLTTGNVVAGSISDTKAVNQVYHQIEDVGGVMDFYYQFDLGSFGRPSEMTIDGRINGANDPLIGYAWDWDGSVWEVIGISTGQGSTEDIEKSFPLFANHVGTVGADLGKVRIRIAGTGLTSADIYIDQIRVGYAIIPSTTGYENGAVWLDTVNGIAGSTVDYNGIASRPVNSIADALTLANNIGLKRIIIVGDSSITFAATMDNFTLAGTHWTLVLGGQSCDGTHITGAVVSGICTGELEFRDCHIDNITLDKGELHVCNLRGTITLNSADDYIFERCYSGVAGTGSPILDFGAAIGSTNVNFRAYSGGLEIKNMGQLGSDIMSLEGVGQYIINANCTGGNLSVRGLFEKIDNSGGAVTITEDARYNQQQISDSLKLAPVAGSPAAGSVNKHLDDIEDDTGINGVILADNAITPVKFNDVACVIPYQGGIWIDSSVGNTNTVPGIDGLQSNPVSTLTAARTLADAIGIKKYFIVNDSTLTLTATHLNWVFEGIGLRNQLSLGSQNVNDSHFFNIVLSGTQGGTQKIQTHTCYLNGITNLNVIAEFCWLTSDNTLAVSIMNIFDHCSSNVPGASTPGLVFQAGTTSIGFRHYSGGLEVKNMTSDHTMSFDCPAGQLVVENTCTSGNISARGCMNITDNGTTMNITDVAVYNTNQVRDAVLDDATRFSGADIGTIITDIGSLNNLSPAEVAAALVNIGLDHLISASVAGSDVADNSIIAQMVSKAATADWDTYDNTTDSKEATRDRGDVAWITGGGGGITDIINVQPLIPNDIDLANTATYRFGLMLINSLDDLPSPVEITPGTISIDRKAIGGTSWSSIVSNAAMSEIAGMVYYDEVLDGGSGYSEGDSIQITMKSVKITVAANDYEIIGATGRLFYTSIRQTMRGTDEANTTTPPTVNEIRDDILDDATRFSGTNIDASISSRSNHTVANIWDALLSGMSQSGSVGKKIADWLLSAGKVTVGTNDDKNGYALNDPSLSKANVSGLATSAELSTHDTGVKVLLPTTLVGGRMSSDVGSISGSADAANKLEASAKTIVVGVAVTGTLSTTEMTTNLSESTNDHYNGRIIIWTSGVLKDQATNITDYDGVTKMLTYTAVTEAPSNTDTFVIV